VKKVAFLDGEARADLEQYTRPCIPAIPQIDEREFKAI